MIRSHIAEGIGKATSRKSLILLLYLVGLGIAALLAVPVVRTIDTIFGSSGFSPELAERFDIVLVTDMMDKAKGWIGTVLGQFFWAIPLFIIWKVASQVGLVYALKDDGQASFWEGVSRFTLRGLLLALIYLLLGGVLVTILWVVLYAIMKGLGEPGMVWTALVIGPLLTLYILASFDLMHDYARMRLVLRGNGIWRSFLSGSFFPIRRISALFLYKFWFLIGAVLWLIPFWLDMSLAKTTIAGMLGAFLLQQIVILARHGVTVGWIGSEVSYFEARAEIVEPEIEPDESEPEAAEPTVSEEEIDPDLRESTGDGPQA